MGAKPRPKSKSQSPQPPRPGMVSRQELAIAMHTTQRTVDRWVRKGVNGIRLPSEYHGYRVWFDWKQVQAWQEAIRKARLGK